MALSSELRSILEKAIVAARDAAEEASAAALGVLAVDADRVPDHFDEETRRLRVALRAEARQLGGFERLIEECAYEQWHRMLFARFLAENDLLIHPEHGVPVTLAECEEIAHARGETDLWLVASELASTMLPGIFRSDDPVLQLALAPEGQQRLEALLAGLPREIFTSEDGLGWVYQYWQAKKKKEVNASERKIGGADIAPVTQLFTENYMVRFLLENTLGAWWASRRPESPLVREWEYLRFDDDGKPAAGGFPGWPEMVAEVTVMDPCCGSGHFLVVAFEMLRQMRMEAERLSAADAGDAVLRDNLFGLELDPRCTQIAAFALALQAWKTGGYRELPIPHIACSGISAKGRLEDWKKLARGDERLERSLEQLHALFSDAGDLGSLIDPSRESDGELLTADFETVGKLLVSALGREQAIDPTTAVFGGAAIGALHAATLLSNRYSLVVSNVPYLARGSHSDLLTAFADRRLVDAKQDLATMMMSRCLNLLADDGALACVAIQSLLSRKAYIALRQRLLTSYSWPLLARIGAGAFAAISGEVVSVALFMFTARTPDRGTLLKIIDLVEHKDIPEIRERLAHSQPVESVEQLALLKDSSCRVRSEIPAAHTSLGDFASALHGQGVGDGIAYYRMHWELSPLSDAWELYQLAPARTAPFAGREAVVLWEHEDGQMARLARSVKHLNHKAQQWRSGKPNWGKSGVVISLVGERRATIYTGQIYGENGCVVVPNDAQHLPAIWRFATSPRFTEELRRVDPSFAVSVKTVLAVHFEPREWSEDTNGVPDPEAPESDDPSQWLFHGHPSHAENGTALAVATARLLGYRWPTEADDSIQVSDRGRRLVAECRSLRELADEDGIVCIPSVRGERPASERLRALLAAAFGEEWSPAKEADLLTEVGYAGKLLEEWLRDGFFAQHCQLFHQRPFVWQIWDGRKDGFSALVNYHRLDRATLEKVVYTYLGEWIRQQREAATVGTPGADLRLAAAEELKEKLKLILEGEPPHDIFVRWKPLEEQPLGWEPDLNDGVRVNIRPFVTAGVLRKNPKIKWGKDRGKDPESAPWYPVFEGDRINDHHLTLAEKRAAREAAERQPAAS